MKQSNIIGLLLCLASLVMLCVPNKTRTAKADAFTDPVTVVGAPFYKENKSGVRLRGYYRIKTLAPKQWNYVTWEYTPNPDGSIRFIDRQTRKGVTVSPPFIIEEEYAAAGN